MNKQLEQIKKRHEFDSGPCRTEMNNLHHWCASKACEIHTDRGELLDMLEAADRLEALMPIWTRITDDPETWPGKGQEIALEDIGWIVWPDLYGDYKVYHTLHWRPLTDYDRPPEQES